jgi:hypothetical protein
MPIFDTDHGMPLSTIQGVHHQHVEAIFFFVKVMLPREYLLGKFLEVNQACKVDKLADLWGAAQSILSKLTKVLLSHYILQLLSHLCGAVGDRLTTSISIVHVGKHVLDKLLGGNSGGSFPLCNRLLTLL